MATSTAELTVKLSGGGISIPVRKRTYSNSSETVLPGESITVGTDRQVNIAIDVSAVTFFLICSDRAVTIETNSGGSPNNTLLLLANIPYIWHTNSIDAFKLTTDVTAIFATNASGGTASVTVIVQQDASP